MEQSKYLRSIEDNHDHAFISESLIMNSRDEVK